MKVKVLSGAFLIESSDFLLMKRAENRKLAPGMWAGVGGHSEPNEINNPKATCLREIYEETGINENEIRKLDLRYVILRREKAQITLIYYFIGFVGTRHVQDKTQEGKLHWVNESELLDKPMSFELKSISEHYIKSGYRSSEIFVGTISAAAENKPFISWHSLDEWEGIVGV